MNLLVITWSMIASACAMLGLIQVFLWSNSRREFAYLLSALMAFSAAFMTIQEMRLFSIADIDLFQQVVTWQNVAVAMILVPLTWSVRLYLPNTRTWAAVLITLLWTIGLIINFFMPGNLTFAEVHSLEPRTTFWGESYYLPTGVVNNWKWIVDITVLLIPIYVIDAAWRSRHHGRGKRGFVITAGVVFFVLIAGLQAIILDAGLVDAPYMVSVAFLFLVFALTWVFARDAVSAEKLKIKVAQAQNEAQQMMRVNLLGEVASALAHELNQPLAAILGNAQAAQKFLSRPDADLDEIQDILTDIVRDDKRARDIILNMRRMLKGDEKLDSQIDLESMVKWGIGFLANEFELKNVTVHFSSQGQIPTVCGSQVALQQVLLNLLINAEQAMLEANVADRNIWITLKEVRSGAELCICDRGPGIAPSVLSSMFEPFVSTKQDNLGMGLAICLRIVEAQGGRLTAENTDEGACFRIWLPAETSK